MSLPAPARDAGRPRRRRGTLPRASRMIAVENASVSSCVGDGPVTGMSGGLYCARTTQTWCSRRQRRALDVFVSSTLGHDERGAVIVWSDRRAFFRIRLDVLELHDEAIAVGLLLEAAVGVERAVHWRGRRFLERERRGGVASPHALRAGWTARVFRDALERNPQSLNRHHFRRLHVEGTPELGFGRCNQRSGRDRDDPD